MFKVLMFKVLRARIDICGSYASIPVIKYNIVCDTNGRKKIIFYIGVVFDFKDFDVDVVFDFYVVCDRFGRNIKVKIKVK